jgi:RHS repeat-associated protein
MVETQGAVNTEIWYTPAGKTAFMEGSTYEFAYWSAPGGGTVTNVAGNINYYQHKDWLGSTRLVSAIGAQTVYADQAVAPYGEVYAQFGTSATNTQNFAGHTQDTVAGTYDAPVRELNTSQGRWLNPDPSRSGWNLYAYSSNPLSTVDVTGEQDDATGGTGDLVYYGTPGFAPWFYNDYYSPEQYDNSFMSNTGSGDTAPSPADSYTGWLGPQNSDPGSIANGLNDALDLTAILATGSYPGAFMQIGAGFEVGEGGNVFDISTSAAWKDQRYADEAQSLLDRVNQLTASKANAQAYADWIERMRNEVLQPFPVPYDNPGMTMVDNAGLPTPAFSRFAEKWVAPRRDPMFSGENAGVGGETNPAQLLGFTRGVDPLFIQRINQYLDANWGKWFPKP